MRQNTQKGNSPTCLRTRYCPVCNSRSFFRRSRLFYSFPSHIPLTLTFPIRKNLLNSWSEITFQICGKSQPGNRTINLSQFSVLFCNFLILIIVYFCGWKWIVFCTGYFFYMLKNKCVSLQILSEEILFGTKHNFYGYSWRTSAFLEENFFTRSASWMWIHIQKFAHPRKGLCD